MPGDLPAFEMDPDSNWDICPLCLLYLSDLGGFPGRDAMRSYHKAHKRG